MTEQERNQQNAQNTQSAQGGNQQSATRSDTLAEGGARPVNAPPRPTGSEIIDAAGGTDASAAAAQSGNQGLARWRRRVDFVKAAGSVMSIQRGRPNTWVQ